MPGLPRLLQKKVAAREEASLAHERAALQHAQELEARVAGFDAKEKKALRVGACMLGLPSQPSFVSPLYQAVAPPVVFFPALSGAMV